MRSFRARSIFGAVLLSVVLYTPALSFPFVHDACNSIYQAAVSLEDPSHLMDPWMGGVFRIFPKLGFMAGLLLWGLAPWPYRLINILIHALSVLLVGRLATRWTGSDRIGLLTALLFAVGFGAYAKAVIQIANLTMLMAVLLLLISLDLLSRGRRMGAALAYLAAAASHEMVILAPLLLPFLPETGLGGHAVRIPRLRRAPLAAVSLLALLVLLTSIPGGVGELASMELQLTSFLLFPVNTVGSTLIEGQAGDLLRRGLDLIVRGRFEISLALLLLLVLTLLLRRRDSLSAFAVIWIYALFLPAAWLMSGWGGEWMERRYLYLPSVGVCLLAARLIVSLARSGRGVATALLTAVILWSLALDAVVWWKYKHDGWDAGQVEKREAFYREIADLNPRWRTGESVDP